MNRNASQTLENAKWPKAERFNIWHSQTDRIREEPGPQSYNLMYQDSILKKLAKNHPKSSSALNSEYTTAR